MAMTALETNEYIKKHGVMLPNGQIFLTKPLYGFKKVYSKKECIKDIKSISPACIANLIIPVGAIVNLAKEVHSRKLRASEVICWSIIEMKSKRLIQYAYSAYHNDFQYKSQSGFQYPSDSYSLQNKLRYIKACASSWRDKELIHQWIITPKKPFNNSTNACESGIHFFIESHLAEKY